MEWKDEALQLRCGTRRRIPHCKDDYSMLISHDLKGASCHCFRCGFHGFIPHGQQRISDLRRRAEEYRNKIQSHGLELPEDYSLDVPKRAMVWYLKYGISAEIASLYGIGFTEHLDRVVLPIYEDGELVAVQMRAVEDTVKPKYLNPSAYEIQDVLFESEDGKAEWGVVVEDILSCIKIGTLISCVAILGTKMSDARAYKISNKYKNVILWYDNDKAGAAAYKKSARILSMLGVNVYKVHTSNDPKTYLKDEIKRILKGAQRVD